MRTMSGGPCLHYDCSNRNSFGYCKTTVCINEHYQQEQWGLPSTTNKSESAVIKQQTNADRIRGMTDEELAVFLDDHTFSLFGMWARSNFILEFLQSDDWDRFMRSTEKGLQKQKQTNADKIRAMTDEKLADFHVGMGCPPGIHVYEKCHDIGAVPPVCLKCWLEWLKSPVEEEQT